MTLVFEKKFSENGSKSAVINIALTLFRCSHLCLHRGQSIFQANNKFASIYFLITHGVVLFPSSCYNYNYNYNSSGFVGHRGYGP
jgi:hypothetical protein